ncbi:hypothetical protein ACW9YV_21395 (plasmid) [Paraburkholderia strydomiana]
MLSPRFSAQVPQLPRRFSPAAVTVRRLTTTRFVGAPSSQRGQSEQTVRAEQAELMASADDAAQSYGGMPDTTSQAGSRAMSGVSIAPYTHH